MPVRIEMVGEVLTAYLEGEIDHHTAKTIREDIDDAIERMTPSLIILDFREVTFMDSSGIGLVMGRYRQAQYCGAEIHVVNPSPQIYKVMRLAGLDRLAQIEKTPTRPEHTAKASAQKQPGADNRMKEEGEKRGN